MCSLMATTALTIALLLAAAPGAQSIGEGVLDLNALLGIFSGMANIFGEVNTTDINIDRLMGKWHQMYKAAINFDVFQTNMYCQVAYLTKNKVMGRDGFSMEEAFHVVAKNGPIEVYKRDITKTGAGEFWMYTEEYFYPRQFYILKVGPEEEARGNQTSNEAAPYDYLVATDSNRLALMVFARDPVTFHDLYDSQIQAFLAKQGFGGYVFWNQPVAIYHGNDCYYPSEQEVFARRVLKGSNGAPPPQQISQRQGLAGLGLGPSPAGQPNALLAQQRAFNARQAALLSKPRSAAAVTVDPLAASLQQLVQQQQQQQALNDQPQPLSTSKVDKPIATAGKEQ